ncbi:SAP30-binding protein isoform X7 [Macaca mulatta]|uniref:SAP30-binding protein isoform X7 n=1 Tax=Macaca mulatta TaxID=9544 RepID=UPI0010A246CE|nr:SAP30-binding protein isoform X7 [Macaca mulatta]
MNSCSVLRNGEFGLSQHQEGLFGKGAKTESRFGVGNWVAFLAPSFRSHGVVCHVCGSGAGGALHLSSRIIQKQKSETPRNSWDKIQKLYERKIKEGMDMNYIIQRKKEFRNPSIYEKLIQFCAIDELGTNYPKDMFDPHGWSEDSYYEALAKAQKIEMDKLEKAKKERTKACCRDVSAAPGDRSCPSPVRAGAASSWIEFVTGTKKGTTTNATATTTTTASTAVADAQKRKSKWDSAIPVTTIAQPTILTTTATLPAVVTVTTSASGSKTTVISAVGTIVKKAKQ